MNTNITTNTTRQNPLLLKVSKEQRKALELGTLSIGAYMAGLGTMALLGHTKSANESTVDITEVDEVCDEDNIVEVSTEVTIASSVGDDMSFDEAFSAARQELGAGGFFNWQGRSYNTYYAEEWEEMDQSQKEEYYASVEENASYAPITSPSSINIDGDADVEITLADVNKDGTVDVEKVDLNNDGVYDIIHVQPEDIEVVLTEEPANKKVAEEEVETVNRGNVAPAVETDNTQVAEEDVEVVSPDGGIFLGPVKGLIDTNNNEIYDAVGYDSDLDGYADTFILDIDEDGHGDILGMDIDLDGSLDVLVYDENQDGFDENDKTSEADYTLSMDEFVIVDADDNPIVKDDSSTVEDASDEPVDFDESTDDLVDTDFEMI